MEKNYLGIDWGKEKIGLSLAHKETRLALPYSQLPTTKQVYQEIANILKKEEVGTVVLGVSRRREERGGKEDESEAIGEKLAKHSGVRVFYADEMFTTKLAQDLMKERGEKNVALRDDAEAAKILLQDWLDRHIG